MDEAKQVFDSDMDGQVAVIGGKSARRLVEGFAALVCAES